MKHKTRKIKVGDLCQFRNNVWTGETKLSDAKFFDRVYFSSSLVTVIKKSAGKIKNAKDDIIYLSKCEVLGKDKNGNMTLAWVLTANLKLVT